MIHFKRLKNVEIQIVYTLTLITKYVEMYIQKKRKTKEKRKIEGKKRNFYFALKICQVLLKSVIPSP